MVQNERSLKPEEQEQAYLFSQDLVTGERVAQFGTGFSFVSAFVNGDELNVFGTVFEPNGQTKSTARPAQTPPTIRAGRNEIRFFCDPGEGQGQTVKVTLMITRGELLP